MKNFLKDEDGATAIEYAMIAFSTVVLGAGLWPFVMGESVSDLIGSVSFSR